jgi:RNA polymerase sigma factor for flagellar operon FliA
MSNPALKKLKRYSESASGAEPGTDAAYREKLILEYAPLVKSVAGRLAMRLPQHVSQEDLASAGIMGLLDAVDKYDSEKGVAFKSYAEFRIRGAMLDELRSMDWVPRSVRRNARKLEAAYAKVENEYMRPASDEEVANELGMNLEEFYNLIEETRGVSLISEEEAGYLLQEAGLDRSPSDTLDLVEIRDVVAKAIEGLPRNERTVISLYYYDELTMREIGEVMEYTESRISQLHTKAVLRLRAVLRRYFDAEE